MLPKDWRFLSKLSTITTNLADFRCSKFRKCLDGKQTVWRSQVSGSSLHKRETPLARYFPIAIITLIRVNRAGTPGALYHVPFSKIIQREYDRQKVPFATKGAFHFNPFDTEWNVCAQKELSWGMRRVAEKRVNYIFLLYLSRTNTRLLFL